MVRREMEMSYVELDGEKIEVKVGKLSAVEGV